MSTCQRLSNSHQSGLGSGSEQRRAPEDWRMLWGTCKVKAVINTLTYTCVCLTGTNPLSFDNGFLPSAHGNVRCFTTVTITTNLINYGVFSLPNLALRSSLAHESTSKLSWNNKCPSLAYLWSYPSTNWTSRERRKLVGSMCVAVLGLFADWVSSINSRMCIPISRKPNASPSSFEPPADWLTS